MEFPVDVALAELVPQLPTGPRWWYEVKLDGHRTVLWRLARGFDFKRGRVGT
ncbi:hypothetical protein ACH5AJ_30985 [Streptomyces rochei]|uniref:hypothetical protein n=1 Tax=Streptomyces rochei TaxID=1928 RepID=UPI00379379AE